jgi:hypothetical protein
MANPGVLGTFDLNVGIKLDIEDVILLLSPYEVPLQGMYGADGMSALSTDECFEKKVEWLDEQLLLPKSTLAAAVATTTATVIQMAAGTGVNFQTGDVLKEVATSELMQVTSWGNTADYLNVSRGFASTTAVAMSSGDTILCLGSSLAEGSVPGAARAVDRVDRYNWTQIFGPTGIQVSQSEQAVQKFGLTSTEFDHQVANRVREEAIKLEQALINGIPTAGSGTVGRTLGGFTNYITSNVDAATTTLSDSAILVQAQACFDAGGYPDRFMVGSKQKRVVSSIDSSQIRYGQDTDRRGQSVGYYETDFGLFSIILNRWCTTNQAFMFAREQATIMTLRPFQFEMLAKTGDFLAGMVVGEKSLRYRRQLHSAMFTALT